MEEDTRTETRTETHTDTRTDNQRDENQRDNTDTVTHTHTPASSHLWNDFNELTLSVMANRTKYDKCKKTISNTTDVIQETFRKEKMYYKERILNMTRDLFHERCENDTINEAHQEYIKACIEYLKWNDITDMVSDDARNELQEKIHNTHLSPPSSPPPSSPPSPASPPLPQSGSSSSSTNTIMSFANKMCIRKKTIDDFIVLKPRLDDDESIKARLPKVRDYQTEITKRVIASAAAASSTQ
jgi:hypothetical protein